MFNEGFHPQNSLILLQKPYICVIILAMDIKSLFSKFKQLDKKKQGYIIGFVLVTVIMLWAFITAGILTNDFNRSQLNNASERQEVKTRGIIITETKDKKKYWEIYGETGNYNNADKKAHLDNIIGNFYKENQVSMSFSAAHGVYDEVAKTITLREEVFIVVEDGTSLKGDELIWQGNDKDILANGNVIIERNGEMVAMAEHAVISPSFDKFKIKGKSSTKIFDK